MIIIGGSAGSLNVILSILKGLDKSILIPIIVVLHRLKNSESSFEEILQNSTHYSVKEVEDKEIIKKGILYTAPSNYHLLLE